MTVLETVVVVCEPSVTPAILTSGCWFVALVVVGAATWVPKSYKQGVLCIQNRTLVLSPFHLHNGQTKA